MPTVKSAIRYAQISGLNFVVNIGLTIFLHEVCALPEEIAFAVALIVVFCMNFVAMRHYIYQGRNGPLGGQFATYTMSAIGFRGTEYLAFLALHSWLGFDYRVVVVGVTLVAAGVKFFCYRFVFEGRGGKPADDDESKPRVCRSARSFD